MNANRKYPRNVWVLTPSFKPKEVTIVKKNCAWSGNDYGDLDEKGKVYSVQVMHKTLDDAIAYGRHLLQKEFATLGKRQITMEKRTLALDKAELEK